MKIECDKCAAKYSIADDKVRGKTFKIRCKKCGNVIIVRDKGATGAADDAADDGAGEAAGAGWHLAVNGETVGPVAEDEVRRRFRSGQIDGETAVWQEGFEDWIPLASVAAFADLAGGGSSTSSLGIGGGDDPFASGGDDSFAAGSGAGLADASASFGAAAAAPAAASPAPSKPAAAAPASNPRATQLTGQRNENSVLFSLDSLRAMAGSAPASGGGGGSTSKVATSSGKPKVATSAPSSEGSGLIDIRAMGAVLGGGGGAAAADLGGSSSSKSDDDVLPTFGGGGFGGLAATPLVVTPPPAAAAPAAEAKSNNTVLYAIVAVLAIALIALGALVITQMNKEPVEKVVIKEVPGNVADGDKDKDKEEERKKKEEEERKKKEKEEEEEKRKKEAEEKAAAATGDTGGEAAGVEGSGKTGGGKVAPRSGSGSGKTGGSTTGPTGPTGDVPSTKPEPKPEPKNSADDVDCLLDPSLPKCKGGSKSGGSKSGGSGGSTGATSGPEKLAQADLLDGIKGVKSAAQACGSKHGVSGVKIPVKLSIEGSSGRVVSAQAQGDYAGKPVGNCVAAELKKATFKKFTSAQMGFTYNVSL